jgi:hypothetical protein
MPRPKKSSSVSRSHRSTLSLSKTEITIHVYDLLPVSEVAHTHLISFHEHDADTRGMTARPIIVGIMDSRRLTTSLRCRDQREGIRLWRT